MLAFAAVLLAAVANNVFAANAAPLGLELGVATLAQVQKEIGSRTQLSEGGTNKYTGGPMLKSGGEGLGIEGLSEIVLVFDKSQKLAAVLMTLPKGGMGDENFNRTLNMLSAKYKAVERQVPFVGNKFAKFRQGDSIVELEAPHLSFEMSLRYLTNQMLADFNSQSAAERADKRRRQASQL
jgi:hypothetical protein